MKNCYRHLQKRCNHAFPSFIVPVGLCFLVWSGLTQCSPTTPAPHNLNATSCESQSFVWIEAGEFIAGSDRNEKDYAYQISAATSAPKQPQQAEQTLRKRRWFEHEPERQLRSQPAFCISRNLVTNAEYQVFIEATEHRSPTISAAEYQQQGFLVHPYADVKPYRWEGSQYPNGQAQHPVVLVSYHDAQAFAHWKGQQDGAVYRLPTAHEWEKAARGTQGQYFPWGNQWQPEATNWWGSQDAGTSAIGTYPLSRSPYGVEDMAGNVFEYTSTLTERHGKPAAVMKGCAWDDLPGFCRAAYRHSRPLESRHILFGFRLVKE